MRMEEVYYKANQAWASMFFSIGGNRYDLAFLKRYSTFELYINRGSYWSVHTRELLPILDYLKGQVTEEDFNKIQKFCFENV